MIRLSRSIAKEAGYPALLDHRDVVDQLKVKFFTRPAGTMGGLINVISGCNEIGGFLILPKMSEDLTLPSR